LPLKIKAVPLYYRGGAGPSAPHLPFKKKVIHIGQIVTLFIWLLKILLVSLCWCFILFYFLKKRQAVRWSLYLCVLANDPIKIKNFFDINKLFS